MGVIVFVIDVAVADVDGNRSSSGSPPRARVRQRSDGGDRFHQRRRVEEGVF